MTRSYTHRKRHVRRRKRRASMRRKGSKIPGRQRGGGGTAIPHHCIQTSKDPLPEYVVTQLKSHMKGWDYTFFTDADILAFFSKQPDSEFPDIAAKFSSFTTGPHKADLFRYYYLYILGGLFVDSDLMLYDSIDTILGTNAFVSVWAIKPEGSVFNGFLAAAPKHPIIYTALKDMYTMTNDDLQKDYTVVCKHLGKFVTEAATKNDVKMLRELANNDTFCTIEDPDSKKVALIHYQSTEIPDIPVV